MNKSRLNDRSHHLLKLLIDQYIQSGQPVGSKILAEQFDLGLSSATIRHVMADLEKDGFLTSLHTSSGRIPTEQAYRLFVDDLLMSEVPDQISLEELQEQLNPHQNMSGLLKTASSMLSDVTRLAGVITLPKQNRVNLKQIEFLALSEHRVLAILVLNNREVQNRIICTDRLYSACELQQAANFINDQYAGKDLLTIRKNLMKSLKQDRQTLNHFMKLAIEIANKAFREDVGREDYMLAGQSHLLGLADSNNLSKMRSLFDAFTQKQSILQLLDQCLNSEGVKIFIGKEAGSDVFQDFSLVAAPYQHAGEMMGVLGVIGPTRMPYNHVISVVDMTARLLTTALNE